MLCMAVQYATCCVWQSSMLHVVYGSPVCYMLCMAVQYATCCVWQSSVLHVVYGSTVCYMLCMAVQGFICGTKDGVSQVAGCNGHRRQVGASGLEMCHEQV